MWNQSISSHWDDDANSSARKYDWSFVGIWKGRYVRNGQVIKDPRLVAFARPKTWSASNGIRWDIAFLRSRFMNELRGSWGISVVVIGCLPGDNFDRRREVQRALKGPTSVWGSTIKIIEILHWLWLWSNLFINVVRMMRCYLPHAAQRSCCCN